MPNLTFPKSSTLTPCLAKALTNSEKCSYGNADIPALIRDFGEHFAEKTVSRQAFFCEVIAYHLKHSQTKDLPTELRHELVHKIYTRSIACSNEFRGDFNAIDGLTRRALGVIRSAYERKKP